MTNLKLNYFSSLAALALAAFLFLSPDAGAQQQQKLAQTGMKFLSVSTDARFSALGEAGTAIESNSMSLFYNPAGMARLNSDADFAIGQTSWIFDINHSYGSVAISPWGGDYGVVGITLLKVNYGDFFGTRIDPSASNTLGYVNTGIFQPTAMAVGIGYATALSDKFSIGGQAKYVTESLGESMMDDGMTNANNMNVPAFDFGIIYKTGFKSLNFGMAIRNFAREITFQRESFQLPLTFKIGISMNILELMSEPAESQSLLLLFDAEHPRDYPEQIRVGAEYKLLGIFALRAGYVSPSDVQNFTFGLGARQSVLGSSVALDFSYTKYQYLKNIYRLTFQFSLFDRPNSR